MPRKQKNRKIARSLSQKNTTRATPDKGLALVLSRLFVVVWHTIYAVQHADKF